MPILCHRDREIPYTLKPSRRRRTLALQVNPEQQVTVFAPARASEGLISRFVRVQADWVIQKLDQFAQLAKDHPPKRYVSGETFLVHGRAYRLEVAPDRVPRPGLELVDGKMIVRLKREGTMREIVARWYTSEAERVVREAVERLSPRLGVVPNRIAISNAKRRWGSCSPKGNLRFNWRLAMMPAAVADYIVIHELAHMKVHNHSVRFWSTVRSILPDYPLQRSWLRTHSNQFTTA